MADKKKAHAGHDYKRTRITHHPDGSHTVTHEHKDGPAKSPSYAASDLPAVHDGLQDHLNAPAPMPQQAGAAPAAPPAAAPAMPGTVA